MRMNEGRIGWAEGISVSALTLFSCGVFALDPSFAYENGNLTYLSIPLSMLVSLLPVLFIVGSMKKTGSRDLASHMRKTMGGVLAPAAALPLVAALVYCAARPLINFTEVLHRLVYDGVSYPAILSFVIPVTVFIAWKGFESIGRLAVIFTGFIALSVAAAAISAAPSFETYRLYPLYSGGTGSFVSFTASETLMFIPPLAALTVCGSGLNGAENAGKTAAVSAAAAAFAACAVQLAIGLVYPYRVLSGLLMPLYRINFLSLAQSYALRLDKLFIMVWLNGAVISAAYCIYAASRLFAGTFAMRDVTPAVAALSAALLFTVMFGVLRDFASVSRVDSAVKKYGWLAAAAPAVLAIPRFRRREKE
ncbi:MAG: GerAB/ArcD/ProY family transporter [Clostridia bacterium]|nr:GerAB/ArcD/ProY family transporter [Clostridia bacterium]